MCLTGGLSFQIRPCLICMRHGGDRVHDAAGDLDVLAASVGSFNIVRLYMHWFCSGTPLHVCRVWGSNHQMYNSRLTVICDRLERFCED